jgi:hypothetical protein
VAIEASTCAGMSPGRPFTDRQIQLAEFSPPSGDRDRERPLFTELRESLEQQTATADIVRVISQSPTDVSPVRCKPLSKAPCASAGGGGCRVSPCRTATAGSARDMMARAGQLGEPTRAQPRLAAQAILDWVTASFPNPDLDPWRFEPAATHFC